MDANFLRCATNVHYKKVLTKLDSLTLLVKFLQWQNHQMQRKQQALKQLMQLQKF